MERPGTHPKGKEFQEDCNHGKKKGRLEPDAKDKKYVCCLTPKWGSMCGRRSGDVQFRAPTSAVARRRKGYGGLMRELKRSVEGEGGFERLR